VGASDDVQYVVESHRLSGVVEGWQWKVTCSTTGVTIEDVRSTNGAILVRKANREGAPLTLPELRSDGRGVTLGWDGSTMHEEPRELRDGDLLVNCYAAFLHISSCEDVRKGLS